MKRPLYERFWEKVSKGDSGECWPWMACRQHTGYGWFTIRRGKQMRANRLAWILTNGDIPEGRKVCHRCDNPSCCNPQHLFIGTQRDNMVDMTNKGRHWQSAKTHCPKGHPYAGYNLLVRSRGGRACRICQTTKNKDIRRRKSAAARLVWLSLATGTPLERFFPAEMAQ